MRISYLLSVCWLSLHYTSRVAAVDFCRVEASGEVSKYGNDTSELMSRSSTIDLSKLDLIECAANIMGDEFIPNTPQVNLELQFMPNESLKQFNVYYDQSLSEGLIAGQGVSGPEVLRNKTKWAAGEINIVVGASGAVVG